MNQERETECLYVGADDERCWESVKNNEYPCDREWN